MMNFPSFRRGNVCIKLSVILTMSNHSQISKDSWKENVIGKSCNKSNKWRWVVAFLLAMNVHFIYLRLPGWLSPLLPKSSTLAAFEILTGVYSETSNQKLGRDCNTLYIWSNKSQALNSLTHEFFFCSLYFGCFCLILLLGFCFRCPIYRSRSV